MELGAAIKVILEPLNLGCVSLLPFLRLGLGVGELFLQLHLLKDEQLEQLTTLVMRLLQKATRAR